MQLQRSITHKVMLFSSLLIKDKNRKTKGKPEACEIISV